MVDCYEANKCYPCPPLSCYLCPRPLSLSGKVLAGDFEPEMKKHTRDLSEWLPSIIRSHPPTVGGMGDAILDRQFVGGPIQTHRATTHGRDGR